MNQPSDSVNRPSHSASEATRERTEAAFAYANATLALEGLVVDAAQAARQQQVIAGDLTIAEAIAQAVAAHSRHAK